jgi:hypothetical protein
MFLSPRSSPDIRSSYHQALDLRRRVFRAPEPADNYHDVTHPTKTGVGDSPITTLPGRLDAAVASAINRDGVGLTGSRIMVLVLRCMLAVGSKSTAAIETQPVGPKLRPQPPTCKYWYS